MAAPVPRVSCLLSLCVCVCGRGRLNVLANVMRKPMPQIFKEFQGTHYDLEEYLRHDWSSAGDVKYHLGTSMDRSYPDGRRVGCRVCSLRLPLLIPWK